MDVIDDVVGSARVGRAMARLIRGSGPWGWRFPAFDGVGFHIIRQGSPWLVTAAAEPITLRTGDIVFAPHGTEHGLSHGPAVLGELPPAAPGTPCDHGSADVEFLCGAYRLEHGQVHHFLRLLPDIIRVSPDYSRHPEIESIVDLLSHDIAQPRPGAEITRAALVDLLLVRVLHQYPSEQDPAEWPRINDAAIATSLREIHQRPQASWTVQQLSDMTGLSRTAFTRRFSTAVGKSPMAYLMSRRLTRGAKLLRETQAPLAVIARRVGYSSEFAFSKAFRREFGIPPGRFRNLSPASEN